MVWYRSIAEGPDFDDVMTDKDGERREVSLHPGIVQKSHVEKLREDTKGLLPAPLADLVLQTAEPFVQAILDAEVPRMAFGRVALVGDAAFALRPHAAVGSAKAAEDGWTLGEEISASDGGIPAALASWEAARIKLGRAARARDAGNRSQFEGS